MKTLGDELGSTVGDDVDTIGEAREGIAGEVVGDAGFSTDQLRSLCSVWDKKKSRSLPSAFMDTTACVDDGLAFAGHWPELWHASSAQQPENRVGEAHV